MRKFAFVKKLSRKYILQRIFYERLTEPLHLNLISLFVMVFGSHRRKCEFDLVIRQQHAYGLYAAADLAKSMSKKRATVIEFGVAAGAGLLNLQIVAHDVTKSTGIEFDIYGFDTGLGMPPPESYKDHPELYSEGDFKMDHEKLKQKLGKSTHLVLGDIRETLSTFAQQDFSNSPISFVSVDLDFYSSTVEALKILKMESENYLPRVIIYLDDLEHASHNSWCGELAAVNEFSEENEFRKIERHTFLRGFRIFKNARWIDHIFQAHILDHPSRVDLSKRKKEVQLTNPYL